MYRTLLLCLAVTMAPTWAVTVTTSYGPVSGQTVDVDNGRDVTSVDVFLGIPYAQDTSGSNRFKKPVAPEPWTRAFVADTLGPSCAQDPVPSISPYGLFGNNCMNEKVHDEVKGSNKKESQQEKVMPKYLTVPGDKYSEDCLSLNIYSPNVTGGPYPVLFWAYGGGYQVGSTDSYHGHYQASHGTVIVTFNYRLGIFGFAATLNKKIPANIALWDTAFALQFIRDNIANFGGDPDMITVGGHSAGSISASLLMLSPQTKDMFHRVLPVSSTETTLGAIRPIEDVDSELRRVAASLGCTQPATAGILQCLREIPWETFFNNATWPELAFAPVVDGPGGFLPESPEALREKGDVMTGPMLASITHDDGAAYIGILVPEAFGDCCSREFFSDVVRKRFIDCFDGNHGITSHQLMASALEAQYSPFSYPDDNWANREAMNQILTDQMLTRDWDAQMSHHSRVGPTYGYVYNYRGRNFTQAMAEWMGIPHGGVLPTMWGWPLETRNPHLLSGSRYNVEWTEEDVRHTIYFMDMLANFYRTGNPTPTPVLDPLGGSTVWPEYTNEIPQVLVISNVTITAGPWRRDKLAFWETVIAGLKGVQDVEKCDEAPVSNAADVITIKYGITLVIVAMVFELCNVCYT